jgi:hypothetical protein
MRGTQKLVIHLARVGSGFYSLFLHCLRSGMPFRCKEAFSREKKCLLNLLWSVLQFQLTFWDEGIHYFLPYRSIGESTISLFRVG